MEMGSAIVGFILTALVVAPFALIIRSNRNKQKYKTRLLTAYAHALSVKLDRVGTCGDMAIGLDQNGHQLLYIRTEELGHSEQQIPLHQVKHCKVNRKCRNKSSDQGRESRTESIALEFFQTGSQPVYVLNLYRADINPVLNNEFEFAIEWSSIINDYLYSHSLSKG